MDAFSIFMAILVIVGASVIAYLIWDEIGWRPGMLLFPPKQSKKRKRQQNYNRSRNPNNHPHQQPPLDEHTRAMRRNAQLDLEAQKALYDMLQEALRSQSEHDEDELPD